MISEELKGIVDKFNHQVEIESGIMKEECSTLLKDFFKKLRNRG